MLNPDMAVLAGLLKEGMVAGKIPFLRVTSGSMRPLFQIGDEVGLQPVTLSQLQPGDIVVVSDRDQLLTHRFYGTQNVSPSPEFLTRGDRVLKFDKVWRADQLLGRAVVRRRSKHMLWLDYGLGRWLNKTLAQISQYEARALDISPTRQTRWQRPVQRMVTLPSRALAEALTWAVETYEYRQTVAGKYMAFLTGE